jgi:hypothetical protein
VLVRTNTIWSHNLVTHYYYYYDDDDVVVFVIVVVVYKLQVVVNM